MSLGPGAGEEIQDRLVRLHAAGSEFPGRAASSRTIRSRSSLPYIDWMPFFNAWEFTGKFPDILRDPIIGEAAGNLYADAKRMLRSVVEEKWLQARAVIGLFPANSVADDDIDVYADERRQAALVRLHQLRQQKAKPQDQAQLCLADFIAPAQSGRADYIGAFAVTAGIGIDAHVARFEAAHDDYSSIMLKALADRLAEAFAERMHERVRREFWGYAAQRAARPHGVDSRGISRHPPGARLPRLPRSHGKGDAVETAGCASARRAFA